MEDKGEKQFQLELTTFGKRNKQRFRIMEDLTLSCDMCKTPEATRSIREMTERYFQELMREQNSLNKRIDKMLKDAAKGGDKKSDNKALEKNAKRIIDQFTSLHLGGNRRLKLKFNGLKKPPYIIFEMKW
ncbi:hypothetical protein SAMN05444007_103266 [Cribrihabitans marinus]|uniref:Uncharacterized protein n=1 Tax=Cribrihabitans marinus TaxID=1227549 RepID=A0A1H6VUG9_9RHOB|nr:hypothetical protein [Cribrihabitans marinus]GGH25247.1 hypothetical protein GCM10010973_12290 [Cribrihabitans marinus]SEJ07366.1 hypothetical protein SAMN05444007_103266 [Cribrihabitans marinus]